MAEAEHTQCAPLSPTNFACMVLRGLYLHLKGIQLVDMHGTVQGYADTLAEALKATEFCYFNV